ncbi:MAG: hypothetical protein LUB59_01715 [Candidatus Gastranaerophilales bacterium]|nr:hypothetical protein [Candidatus Gastranaerophilales bacterium]
MANGYDNFDNTEMNFRKDALIQERVGLVSTHMYKQFLDYQNATRNTAEVFAEIIPDMKAVVESLKKSFATRGITTQNIYVEYDSQKTVVTINILWHTISLTTRCNYEPQALFREKQQPLFCGRIMALKGVYSDIIKGADDKSECMKRLLDNEIASLYVPADKMQNSVFKIRHLSNREFFLNSQDSAKEFVLKVIEIVCGGGVYHEEGTRKSFNI